MIFRVNEPGKDPGYGQSILHEDMLIFRTPPYIVNEISLQDTFGSLKKKSQNANKISVPDKFVEDDSNNQQHSYNSNSPNSITERKVNRRYSSTSIR